MLMSGDKFEDTVKNLLRMKPKPHDEAKDGEKKGDAQKRRSPASSSDQSD